MRPAPTHDGTRGRMIERRTLLEALSIVVFSLLAMASLAHADDSAMRVSMQENSGYYRGAFLDRMNRPLASMHTGARGMARVYSLRSLASTVGYRDPTGQWHGLEAQYSAFLTSKRARTDWHTFFLHLRGQPARGGSIRLTLDRRIQQTADMATGNMQGAAVALDPSTGAVLALVDKPYCSPVRLASAAGYRDCQSAPAQPLRDRALGSLFAPGSSFKIVTLSAAIDTGRFNLGSLFSGADVFGPSPYFDNLLYPSNVTRSDLTQLTLRQALAFSDNFTFAHIGLTLGAQTLLRYAHRYFVGRSIPFSFPVSPSVIANGHARPSLSELAQSSFGAGVDRVTPLQMALIASTVANHGVMMAPHLVDELISPSGRVLTKYAPHALSFVMSPGAAAQVKQGMEFVVDHGSGIKAQIGGMRVAGKTGTATSGGQKPNAWFISFAPADHPVVAVAVLHEDSGEGFEYAAPIARKIMITALQERGFHVR